MYKVITTFRSKTFNRYLYEQSLITDKEYNMLKRWEADHLLKIESDPVPTMSPEAIVASNISLASLREDTIAPTLERHQDANLES